MKKLIEYMRIELANVFQDGTKSNDYFDGFAKALEIVKSYDPWIDVSELPEAQDETGFFVAYLLFHKGLYWVAYHDLEFWRDESNDEIICTVTDVVAKWTYLPEVKP